MQCDTQSDQNTPMLQLYVPSNTTVSTTSVFGCMTLCFGLQFL